MGNIDDSPRIPSTEGVTSQCEDQAAMTIEFLRARLLSERAVSKAARQRAQQLAKKVLELEQRMESEIHKRKRLDEARLELLSKHKGELMEDYGHLFPDNFDKRPLDDIENPTQQGSPAQRERKSDDTEGAGELNAFEGNASNQGGQDDDGDGVEEDDMDRVAREKGMLAWASRRSNRKLQVKEWTRFNRSFSPSSFSTLSPDRDSPRKRWVGKSVRQIRTRTISMDVEGDGEVKQDQAKDGLLQSDEERDEEVKRILEQQSELIEQFKAEENAQRAWEKKFREQNRPKDDISKDEDSFSDARGEEEEGEVLITSEERDIKERAESTHGIVKLAEKVNDASKQHAEDAVGETLEGLHSDITGLTSVLSTAVIHESRNISEGEFVVGADNTVSEERPSGEVDNEECKNTAELYSMDMPHKSWFHDISHDSSEGRMVVTTSDFIPYTPTNVLDEINPTSTADALQEGLRNEIDLQGYVYNGGACVSSGSTSVSSSQGSIAALDSASYQRQDMFSTYANNQEQFDGVSRDSSERPFRNRDYVQESYVRSPSTAFDNDKPFKKDNYERKTRGSTFGSPGNGNSSRGSSKGLMSSSWEEIFQRRIKSQEAMKVENDLNNGSPHPLSFIEKQHLYAQTFNTSTRTPHTYTDSPYMYGAYDERMYGAYDERRPYARIHHNSEDAGLDRVTDVLRALQIAKHHLQSSDEFGYSHQFMPNASGSYFSSLPAREMEPFMYDIEDGRMAAGSGYVRSPSRQPISMQHAWIRGEPIAGQYTWLHHENHAYPPPYAGQHSR